MEPEPLHHRVGRSVFFLVVGAMLIALPLVTWKNSVGFALLFSPGLLLGPLLVYGSWVSMRGSET